MKNNKGFTLIELLITIVMMLSLTILVVVGFTKVSDEKKKEADNLTENEILSAAEQYFSSEYYWIEYLKSGKADKDDKGNSYIHVNLAKLIKEDYLNVVSSATTEKKFSKCDIVKVTYKNKLKFEYIKDESNKKSCNPEIKLAGPIDINYTVKSGNIEIPNNKINGTNWYNTNIKLNISLKADTFKDYTLEDANVTDNDYIKDVKILVNGVEKKNISTKEKELIIENFELSKNGLNKVEVIATNYNDVPSKKDIYYYIDKTKPTVNINAYRTTSDKKTFTDPAKIDKSKIISPGDWTNDDVYLVSIGEDNISGIYKSGSACTYNVRKEDIIYDNSKTTYDSNKTDYQGISKYGLFLRYYSDIVDTVTCRFKDNAGNLSDAVTFTVKRDNTKPNLTLSSFKSKDLSKIENHTATSTYDSGDWYSGYADVIATAKDNISKVTLRYQRSNDGNGGSKPKDMSKQSDAAKEISYKTYSKAEGTSYYTFTATDEAGNTRQLTYTVKLDRTDPTCSVTASGKLGNKVNGDQWFLTNDVTVKLDESKDQAHRSGINSSVYGLSQKTDTTFNSKNSATESDEGLATWNCYVKDNAGNEGEGHYTFGLEKTVKIEFDASLTNSGYSEGSGKYYDKLVFNSSLTNKNPVPCGYGTCKNIKCRTNNNSEYCAKERFARSCRYVKSYPRFFKVTAISEYDKPTLTYAIDSDKTSVTINGTTYSRNDRITRMVDYKRYGASSDFKEDYDYRYVGTDGSGINDFSAHKYQYESPAGLKSNGIRLYTEYATECY